MIQISLPVKEIPKAMKSLLKDYKNYFTKSQYNHFINFVTGLIVSDNKTVQEINDCFNKCDQSSLNRFLTKSDWDPKKVNDLRLKQVKKRCELTNGIFICDPTMLHKTGKYMEKAGFHYSGLTKNKEWGHLLVPSFYTDSNGNSFPIAADIYLREKDADKQHPFKTIREICLEQLNYSLKKKLPIKIVMLDCGLYAGFVLQEIKSHGLKYLVGVKKTNKIRIGREERMSIDNYFNTLTTDDFQYHFIDGKTYFLHTKEIFTKGVGKEKLLISWKDGDEETVKIYTTNLLSVKDKSLMELLLKRWKIEGLHRDEKQHLGLEAYQVRKFGAIQKVVCAILVAYTQIILNKTQAILRPFKRSLETIGEGCRFLRLIALKGWRWLRRRAENIEKLRTIMNSYVFIKNAKV